MANDKEYNQHEEPGAGRAESTERGQKEQFNELSELSLEERMAVADQIGIPVNNLGDAVATGAMRDRDETADEQDSFIEEENTSDKTER